jgi:hypothetical protein
MIDERYLDEKRKADVYGDNGLTVGDWWPLQHAAWFHGAHGHTMQGIYGSCSRRTSQSPTFPSYRDLIAIDRPTQHKPLPSSSGAGRTTQSTMR